MLHLRYPNAHTHWFSSLMLHLFQEVDVDRFREIMTKVLLERFLVHRPHPWGALVTFIELLRNPKYDFWNHDFIRIAPEVTLLLETVRVASRRLLFALTHNAAGRKVDLPILDCCRYRRRYLFYISACPLIFGFCSHRICILTRPPVSHVSKGIFVATAELCLPSGFTHPRLLLVLILQLFLYILCSTAFYRNLDR